MVLATICVEAGVGLVTCMLTCARGRASTHLGHVRSDSGLEAEDTCKFASELLIPDAILDCDRSRFSHYGVVEYRQMSLYNLQNTKI